MHTDTLTYAYEHITPMYTHTDPHRDIHVHILEHTVRPKQVLQKGLSSLHEGPHLQRWGCAPSHMHLGGAGGSGL